MGTDIHMVAEVRQDGAWRMVTEPLFPNPYYDPKTETDSPWPKPLLVNPYSDRNYDLFAMLADVRNGHGFAGVPTGDGFVPIADQRGVPEDADPATVEFNEWGGYEHLGDHSFSWLSVAELDAYDWDQTTHKTGVMSERDYVRALRTGRPERWSGSITGPGIVVLSPEEWEETLKSDVWQATSTRDPDLRYYIQHRWKVTYRERAGEYWFRSLDTLRSLGAPDDVRIVFGFDS